MTSGRPYSPENPRWSSPTGEETAARLEQLLQQTDEIETKAAELLRGRHPEINLSVTTSFQEQAQINRARLPSIRTWFATEPFGSEIEKRKTLNSLATKLLEAGPETRLFETTIGQQFLDQLTELLRDYSGDIVTGADGQRFWIPLFPKNAIPDAEAAFQEYFQSDSFRRTTGYQPADAGRLAREFVRGCELHELVEMTYRNRQPAVYLPPDLSNRPKQTWVMSEREWAAFQGAREVLTNQVLYRAIPIRGARLALVAGTISYLGRRPLGSVDDKTAKDVLETLPRLVVHDRREDGIESRVTRDPATGTVQLSLLPIRGPSAP